MSFLGKIHFIPLAPVFFYVSTSLVFDFGSNDYWHLNAFRFEIVVVVVVVVFCCCWCCCPTFFEKKINIIFFFSCRTLKICKYKIMICWLIVVIYVCVSLSISAYSCNSVSLPLWLELSSNSSRNSSDMLDSSVTRSPPGWPNTRSEI